MKQLLNFIQDCPTNLSKNFIRKTFEPCEHILNQGDSPSCVYILLKGKAKVSSFTHEGMIYTEYIYHQGELFGEIEVLNCQPNLSSVLALTRCEVIQIHSEIFKKWLLSDPHFSLYISTQLASKLYQSCVHAQLNIGSSLKDRILYFLYHYSVEKVHNGVPKNLITESVLSNTRSVNRILKELSDEHLITIKNGLVWLNNTQK